MKLPWGLDFLFAGLLSLSITAFTAKVKSKSASCP